MIDELKISEETFTKTFKEYSDRIVLYLNRFVGREDAEDLMQEVFIKAYNSLNSFEGNSKLSTWIYKIATNAALDKLKSYGYRKEKNKVTSLEYVEPLRSKAVMPGSEESDIEYSFLKTEMNQCIADYINRLPDNYRAIFLLKEYEDRTTEEISEITLLSVDNVKIRLHRARK
jgi:RNA polymerase sigma-70 factor (ECF subfamily)